MTAKQLAEIIDEEFKLHTTAEIVRAFREQDKLTLLIESLVYMSKGNRIAIIDALSGVYVAETYLERPELIDKDIIEDMRGS